MKQQLRVLVTTNPERMQRLEAWVREMKQAFTIEAVSVYGGMVKTMDLVATGQDDDMRNLQLLARKQLKGTQSETFLSIAPTVEEPAASRNNA